MTLLVTGGAGFIGANFIFHRLATHPGERIVCLDKLTGAADPDTLAGVLGRPELRFVRGDICDAPLVDALFREERPGAVVHFAAESHVDRSLQDPGLFLRTNVLGTGVLLEACRRYGGVRFHQVGTDEVYGDLPLDAPEALFTEESPLRPSSPYSASKAGADLLALAYHRTWGLPVTVSRCSNNYGPWQATEKLIPLVITRALSDLPLPVYGRGENVRDWLHVSDHLAALDLILDRGVPGEIYDLSGRCERRNIDVVRQILRLLEKPESLIAFVEDRKGHDLRYAVDPAKAQKSLGWRARIDFDEGLADTVEWYLAHRDWWEGHERRARQKGTDI